MAERCCRQCFCHKVRTFKKTLRAVAVTQTTRLKAEKAPLLCIYKLQGTHSGKASTRPAALTVAALSMGVTSRTQAKAGQVRRQEARPCVTSRGTAVCAVALVWKGQECLGPSPWQPAVFSPRGDPCGGPALPPGKAAPPGGVECGLRKKAQSGCRFPVCTDTVTKACVHRGHTSGHCVPTMLTGTRATL